jgi:hypothetical protein
MVMWVRKSAPMARSRGELLARIERLVRKDNPRLMMTGIVAATSVAGVLASVVLRRGGLSGMWLRYGISVAFAYFSFLFFCWLWILVKSRRRHRDPVAEAEDGDEGEILEDLMRADLPSPTYGDAGSGVGVSAGGDAGGGGFGLDDGIVLVAVILAIAAAIGASVYVIAIAPELLAELLLDGVFATIFFRRVRVADRRHWFQSALARTWIAALVAAAFFVIAGAVCQWYAPEASTLGGVLHHWEAKRHPPAPPQPIDLDSAF